MIADNLEKRDVVFEEDSSEAESVKKGTKLNNSKFNDYGSYVSGM